MEDTQFRKTLDHFGLSWKGYHRVRQGVKKRLARHMQQLKCRSREEYFRSLDENPEEMRRAKELLTVSISRFFRDEGLWQALAMEVIPALMEQAASILKIRSAGCSCGEEAYSIKILWDVVRKGYARWPALEVWATDMNPEVLDKAQAGTYSASSLRNVPVDWRSIYFRPVQKGGWAIADFLKEGIYWGLQDLILDDPPADRFQIVFLRNNVLTYNREEFRKRVISRVIEHLSEEGFLIIGSHEKLPGGFPCLRSFPGSPMIYKKSDLKRNPE